MLKESHVVCGCRLQVKLLEPPSESKELPNEQYDLSKLKISMHNNIPPDHLSLLISTLFDIEEDNFKVEIHDNSALISFDTSFTLNRKLIWSNLHIYSQFVSGVIQNFKKCVQKFGKRS